MGVSAPPLFESSSETGAGKLELLRFIGAEVASVEANDEEEDDEEGSEEATSQGLPPS